MILDKRQSEEDEQEESVEGVEDDVDNLERPCSMISDGPDLVLDPEAECSDWSVGLVTGSRGDVVSPEVMMKNVSWIIITDILVILDCRYVIKHKLITHSSKIWQC